MEKLWIRKRPAMNITLSQDNANMDETLAEYYGINKSRLIDVIHTVIFEDYSSIDNLIARLDSILKKGQ